MYNHDYDSVMWYVTDVWQFATIMCDVMLISNFKSKNRE